ncbi:MAG: hypothetical protein HYW23_01970 [Candidatus Aenigmarchaeota archaeon]|nr:hypothetical protein [Candidatus Aenigmarchaeota archaeon]
MVLDDSRVGNYNCIFSCSDFIGYIHRRHEKSAEDFLGANLIGSIPNAILLVVPSF